MSGKPLIPANITRISENGMTEDIPQPGSSKVSLMMFPYHSKTKPTIQILSNVKFVVVNTYYGGKYLWTIGT